MAQNVRVLSPLKLKELKNGEKITIKYAASQQEIDAGGDRILMEQFPKKVATAFSTVWAPLFPTVNMMSLAEMSKPQRSSVTIINRDLKTVKTILSWVLSCCDGKGMQVYEKFDIKPYFEYAKVRDIAGSLGITVLVEEMDRRLKAIEKHQIHSEDVRAMYLQLPANHPVLKEAAKNIAQRFFDHKLRAWGAYKTLREEIPQFDADFNDFLNPMLAERKAEQARERAEKIANTKKNHKDKAQKQKSDGLENTQAPVEHTTTLQCEVARKAANGRPAYAALPLEALGVTRDSFVRDDGPRSSQRKARK